MGKKICLLANVNYSNFNGICLKITNSMQHSRKEKCLPLVLKASCRCPMEKYCLFTLMDASIYHLLLRQPKRRGLLIQMAFE